MPIQYNQHQTYATTTNPGSTATGISLPPISTLHREHDPILAHQYTQDAMLSSGRMLPSPYHPMMPQPEYVQPGRSPYPTVQTPYSMPMTRMPLPSSVEAVNMLYNASRQIPKQKDVKRRTKTGCLTCRKRRIKVSFSLIEHQHP